LELFLVGGSVLNRITHRLSYATRQRRIGSVRAINFPCANWKFAPAKVFVRIQLGDHVFLRVRSPCSINFQNSRLSFSCSSSPVGSLVRKRKSRRGFLCRTRCPVI